MARKGKNRRMGKYIRGTVDEELDFDALAAKDVASGAFDESVAARTLVSSILATYSVRELTIGAGLGPLIFGVAHSDYSASEIEVFLETTGSWDEGNLIDNEISKRKIRVIGTIALLGSSSEVWTLNDGKPVKTKLNWILVSGDSLQLWVYNAGTAAVATTTPTLTANGHVNLWPR